MKQSTWGAEAGQCDKSQIDSLLRGFKSGVFLALLATLAIVMFSGCAGFTGPAPAQISLSQSSVSFGTVTVGQSDSQPIKISNPGSAALTISKCSVTGAGFSTSGLTAPLTIQPGQSATFNAVFDPVSASASSGSVSLSSNAPSSPATLVLTGTGGAETHVLSVSPSSLAFGSLALNSSGSKTVSLKNTGNSNITISSVSTTGAGFADSGVNANLVLSPNQSASLDVSFDPKAAGAASGKVTIASNAGNSPESVSLSGTGTSSHSVSLAWTASSSSSIVGYNVYRGTTSGTYSKLNGSPVTDTSYTDSTVQSGQNLTYYYVVTAVDSAGAESTDSNQATATVP
jgi:P pilus assembly chaperone PapD